MPFGNHEIFMEFEYWPPDNGSFIVKTTAPSVLIRVNIVSRFSTRPLTWKFNFEWAGLGTTLSENCFVMFSVIPVQSSIVIFALSVFDASQGSES